MPAAWPPSRLGGVPRQILYDRMKTAVTGEDAEGHIVYNRALVDFARHHGYHPKACRPYRAKTKGKVERPYRYIREDFFLARSFRNLDDRTPSRGIGSTRSPTRGVHATTGGSSTKLWPRRSRSSSRCRWCRSACPQARAAPLPRGHGQRRRQLLQRAPIPPADASSRCRPTRSRSSRASQPIAVHSVLEGRNQRRVAPSPQGLGIGRRQARRRGRADCDRPHGTSSPGARPTSTKRSPCGSPARRRRHDGPRRSGQLGARPHQAHPGRPCDAAGARDDRRHRPPARTRCEVSPLEAIETLLAEEFSIRENRRVKTAPMMARLSTVKTLAGFDFAFQPSPRPQPRPGARPARLRRPPRGGPSARPTRHR